MFRHGEMHLLPHARRIMQHRDRTRRGNSAFPFDTVFRIWSCVFSFGAHISSWSRTRDTTLIRGLNHGWNRVIVILQQITRLRTMKPQPPGEIDQWNLEVTRHFRALFGSTPVNLDPRLHLQARWVSERKFTTYWLVCLDSVARDHLMTFVTLGLLKGLCLTPLSVDICRAPHSAPGHCVKGPIDVCWEETTALTTKTGCWIRCVENQTATHWQLSMTGLAHARHHQARVAWIPQQTTTTHRQLSMTGLTPDPKLSQSLMTQSCGGWGQGHWC